MSESLRDQLAANLDKITTVEAPAEPAAPTEAVEAPPASEPVVHESKVGAETRARDDKTGQFKKQDKAVSAAPVAAAPVAAAPAAPAKPAPQRPSSWKKDYWGDWDNLVGGKPITPERALALAEYMNTREADFQHGVAAYKREWDNAKPVMEALHPFLPILQQHGIQPNVWVANLGAAHRELATGSPQQKLERFQWLAKQYGVPLNVLTDEAARAQYLQSQPQAAAQPQQGLTVEQAKEIWRQEFTAQQSTADVGRFISDMKEKHPYIEDQAFKETMAQLLESGLADDLQSAHDQALAHPRHSAIRNELQAQEQAAKAEATRAAEAQRVAAAKGKAVSVRSSTPTPKPAESPKDRRSQLEENFDSIMGGARV